MTAPQPIKTKLVATVGDLDLHESGDGNLYVTAAGETKVLGGAWGPAADGTGNWFAWWKGSDPVRVNDWQAARDYVLTSAVVTP